MKIHELRVSCGVLAVATLVVVAGACKDHPPTGPAKTSEEQVDSAGEVPVSSVSGTVQVTVTAGPFQGDQQTLEVRVENTEGPLGSYQGRFTFDPEVLSLKSVQLPDGDFRVVNDRQAEEGMLRFAAFSTKGFAVPIAMRMTFATPRPVETKDVGVVLEVVGTIEGLSVPSARFRVSRQLQPRLQ